MAFCRENYRMMTINELKKELSLTNTEIAEFFGLSPAGYANSSAKPRYEAALLNFYAFVKSKAGREKENKTAQPTTDSLNE